jgi:hypothetical protein
MLFLKHFSLLLLTLLVLSGCNAQSSREQQKSLSTLSSSPSPQPSPTPTLQPQITPFDIDGLLHVTNVGSMTCSPLSHYSYGAVVLATDPTNYDSVEIDQIVKYVDPLNGAGTTVWNYHEPLPPKLKEIPGAVPLSAFPSECSSYFQVSNISSQSVQISGIVLRYTGNGAPNTEQYRLIDACTMGENAKRLPCPKPIGGGGKIQEVEFQPKMASAETVLEGMTKNKNTLASPVNLAPEELTVFVLEIRGDVLQGGLIVPVIPEITLDTLGKHEKISLPLLKGTITIAAPRNVSCYALQENKTLKRENVKSGCF